MTPPNAAPSPTTPPVLRVDLAGAVDAERDLAPASALIETAGNALADRCRAWSLSPGALAPPAEAPMRLLALDHPAAIDAHPAARHAPRLALPTSVLMPGLVNAHTHLDLSAVGPLPAPDPGDPAGFDAWLRAIRDRRTTDAESAARAVALGAALSEASGVVAVGDIAGALGSRPRPETIHALFSTPLLGVGFLEFFAIGAGEEPSLDALERALESLPAPRNTHAGTLRAGLQPHAPYTVGLSGYRRAVDLALACDLPLATHLAETLAERRCITHAEGPLRDLLETLGAWNDALADEFGIGRHPIDHLAPALRAAGEVGLPFLAAHLADVPDHTLDTLVGARVRAAYCPRGAAFFHATDTLGPHRYRDMLDAGISVALGTDSVASLPPDAADPQRGAFGPLAEARLLHRRDATDPRRLIAMCTTHGAAALQLEPASFTLAPGGVPAGLVLVALDAPPPPSRSASQAVLDSDAPPRLLARPIPV